MEVIALVHSIGDKVPSHGYIISHGVIASAIVLVAARLNAKLGVVCVACALFVSSLVMLIYTDEIGGRTIGDILGSRYMALARGFLVALPTISYCIGILYLRKCCKPRTGSGQGSIDNI